MRLRAAASQPPMLTPLTCAWVILALGIAAYIIFAGLQRSTIDFWVSLALIEGPASFAELGARLRAAGRILPDPTISAALARLRARGEVDADMVDLTLSPFSKAGMYVYRLTETP